MFTPTNIAWQKFPAEKDIFDEERAAGRAGMAYEKAFERLSCKVQSRILNQADQGKVASMADLSKCYLSMLAEEGLSVSNYRNDHLKYRLRKKFGEQLTFFRSSKRVTEPEMVTSPSVPQSLLLENVAETIAINDDHETEDHGSF